MKKKRGFIFIWVLVIFAFISILVGIGLISMSKYKQAKINNAYDSMVSLAKDGAKKYFKDNTESSVTFETLVDGKYLSNISDPNGSNDKCLGKVVNNQDGNYNVYLCCGDTTLGYEYPNFERTKTKKCKAYSYDIKDIKEIKVLHIYPNLETETQLSTWMSNKTSGDSRIKVTPVSIDAFNSNPSNYLGVSTNWQYDVVVFGFYDMNGSRDLSYKSSEVIANFLETGGAVLFGHDTLTSWLDHPYFNRLYKYINMDFNDSSGFLSQEQVKIVKSGVFTEYPYKIGAKNTELTIPASHYSGQVAHGDVWLTFVNEAIGGEAASIYLSTYKNTAYIQTGHTGGKATNDEIKIITNVIFYLKSKTM